MSTSFNPGLHLHSSHLVLPHSGSQNPFHGMSTHNILHNLNERRDFLSPAQVNLMIKELERRATVEGNGLSADERTLLDKLKEGPLSDDDTHLLKIGIPPDGESTRNGLEQNAENFDTKTLLNHWAKYQGQISHDQLWAIKNELLDRAAQNGGGVDATEQKFIDAYMDKLKSGTLTQTDIDMLAQILPQTADGTEVDDKDVFI